MNDEIDRQLSELEQQILYFYALKLFCGVFFTRVTSEKIHNSTFRVKISEHKLKVTQLKNIYCMSIDYVIYFF